MIRLTQFNHRQHQQLNLSAGQFEIGRLPGGSPAGGSCPFIHVDDPLLSEVQAIFHVHPDGTVQIGNRGSAIILSSGRRIYRGHQVRLELPLSLNLGESTIELSQVGCNDLAIDKALVNFDLPQPAFDFSAGGETVVEQRGPSSAKLELWFEAISDLQRRAVGTPSFFREAAKSVFDPGGMDSSLILARTTTGWEIIASFVPSPELGIGFREEIVERVAATRSTLFHDADLLNEADCRGDDYIACSPICTTDGQVSHVIYAVRSRHRSNHRVGIRRIEAQFVKLIAESVSAALCRGQLEMNAVRDQVLLQQAFSPEVARVLQHDPTCLRGQEQEVTVLFLDVRGFTAIAEKNPTEVVYQFLSDLMDTFTLVIEANQGVVMDYMGDGLAAFWNAPVAQENHPLLACLTAIDLLNELPAINQRWSTIVGRPIAIGIGIHSGNAQVGNSGSSRRLKFGPRGNTVNLAQRIESATKVIGLPLLISADTAAQLGPEFVYRRICTTRVPGIAKPVGICQPFEAAKSTAAQLQSLKDYEAALQAFENDEASAALHQLIELEVRQSGDAAVEYLLKQVRAGLVDTDAVETGGATHSHEASASGVFAPLSTRDLEKLEHPAAEQPRIQPEHDWQI